MALADQAIGHVAADKTGATRNQNPHALSSITRHPSGITRPPSGIIGAPSMAIGPRSGIEATVEVLAADRSDWPARSPAGFIDRSHDTGSRSI
jgi:hypothetical protein